MTRPKSTFRTAGLILLRFLPPAALIAWIVIASPWEDLFSRLDGIPLTPILLALAVNFGFIMPVRTLRWRSAMVNPPSLGRIYAAMVEGQTAAVVLGMGVGDLFRSARLGSNAGSFSQVLGTAVADRACEYLALMIMLAASVLLGRVPAPWIAVPVAYVAVLAILVGKRDFFDRHLCRWPRVQAGLASLATSLSVRRVLAMTGLAFLAWSGELLMLHLVLGAMGLPTGLGTAVVVLVGINLAIAIPGPPANLGTYEAGVVVSLTALGVSMDAALSFGLFYHALHAVPVALLGAAFWTFRDNRRR